MIIDIFILIFLLISIILTIKYKFTQFKFLNNSIKSLRRSVRNNETSHKAFLLSLGNHIGAGNIIGVCSAMLIGGVGSLFWMSFCLLFTSIYSLIENSLGIKYNKQIDGEYRGGSPYYIRYGLNKKKLSYLCAVILILSSTFLFLPVQVNSLKESLTSVIDIKNVYVFILLLVFSMLCLYKGTNKILKISELIVPFMTALFVLVCLLIIFVNYKKVPSAICEILNEAINDLKIETLAGSLLGGSICVSFKRSIFSNEAGIGTAPSFNSMVKANPLEQGYLQVFACFIDTSLMCTLFGLVIMVSGMNYNEYSSSDMAIEVFNVVFKGGFGKYIGSFFLFTFSLATIIGSYYSGETNILFFGNKKSKISKNIYRIIFSLCLFIGVFFKENDLWNLVDYGIVILGLINVCVIIKMRKEFEVMLH